MGNVEMQQAAESLRRLAEAMPEATPSPTCELCGRTNDRELLSHPGWKICRDCVRRSDIAAAFRRLHYAVPPRFASALGDKIEGSFVFSGEPGVGKTHRGYAILQARATDPRLTIAAYSWPSVLMEMRRGFSAPDAHPDKVKGFEICDALRTADVALIDDLGAEKITEGNAAWIQQELFVILDARWSWNRQTILTTNLPLRFSGRSPILSDYLGERITSRIGQMCEAQELTGRDRRLTEKP